MCVEGVQLLCLIDKGLDACRYLQTYGAWDQAVWLAKVQPGLLVNPKGLNFYMYRSQLCDTIFKYGMVLQSTIIVVKIGLASAHQSSYQELYQKLKIKDDFTYQKNVHALFAFIELRLDTTWQQ